MIEALVWIAVVLGVIGIVLGIWNATWTSTFEEMFATRDDTVGRKEWAEHKEETKKLRTQICELSEKLDAVAVAHQAEFQQTPDFSIFGHMWELVSFQRTKRVPISHRGSK